MYRMGSLWLESALLPSGWASRVRITTQGERIAALTVDTPAAAGDERHALGVPGVPNLHSHAFQRGIAGLTERRGATADSFWSWRELMYRFVERITPDELEALTALAYAEMLEAGFTHVGEFHYLHHDPSGAPYADRGELAARIAAAAARTGIGLTLLPVFYAHGGFGAAAASARQRRFINDPAGFSRLVEASRRAVRSVPGASVGIAPHSLRAVTPAELAEILPLAQGGVTHIHIAEQEREVAECLAWCGRRPIEWLLDNAAVDARWCLVHATHATDGELAAIVARGTVVGLCPITESSLGDGIFPAARYLAARGYFGVGSDSNVRIDAAEELRMLEYSQRLKEHARNVLATSAGLSTGRALFDAAIAGGQRALLPASAADAAALRVGAPLDLVTLDTTHPALLERAGDEVLDSWIFAAGREAVDCVWRAGVKVVSGGRHRERAAIVARFAQVLRSLRAS
jgi:formimidoylglutamate deiminase